MMMKTKIRKRMKSKIKIRNSGTMPDRRPPDPLLLRLHEERIAILDVSPQLDAGRFPIKRISGEEVIVAATIVRDGHDRLAGVLKFMHESEKEWHDAPLARTPEDNRWTARFSVPRLGVYHYTIEAWTDGFATWREG